MKKFLSCFFKAAHAKLKFQDDAFSHTYEKKLILYEIVLKFWNFLKIYSISLNALSTAIFCA